MSASLNGLAGGDQQLSSELAERMRKRRCFADKDLEDLSLANPDRLNQVPHQLQLFAQQHSAPVMQNEHRSAPPPPQPTHSHHEKQSILNFNSTHQSQISATTSYDTSTNLNFIDSLGHFASFYTQFMQQQQKAVASALNERNNCNSNLMSSNPSFFFANLINQINNRQQAISSHSSSFYSDVFNSFVSSTSSAHEVKNRECMTTKTSEVSSDLTFSLAKSPSGSTPESLNEAINVRRAVQDTRKNSEIISKTSSSSSSLATINTKLTNFSVEALLSEVK
jgi:hypothetical protein